MGHSKSSRFYKDSDHWQKMGQVSFVSSVSVAPTFSSGGTQVVHSPILQAGKADHVSINERINATIWGCKN